MAWGPCEYCGYSECECGMAAQPVWISVRERLPEEGKLVLWHNPDDAAWPAFVGRRGGKSLDWGGDMEQAIPKRAFWMELPDRPRCRTRAKSQGQE